MGYIQRRVGESAPVRCPKSPRQAQCLRRQAAGAIIDSISKISTLCCANYHFYELSKKPAGQERSVAIIDKIYKIALCTATISYAVAVNLKDPVTKPIPIAVMAVANYDWFWTVNSWSLLNELVSEE